MKLLAPIAFVVCASLSTAKDIASKRFPPLGFPVNDVREQRRLSPNQETMLRHAIAKLTIRQAKRARFTVTGYEGGPKNILVIFVMPPKLGPYITTFPVINLGHCNIAYDPSTTLLFTTTQC